MAWELDQGAADRFDPSMAGWEVFHGQYTERFPEIEGRRMVFQRDFWVRGDERLIVEWQYPWKRVIAVILNGQVNEDPMTAEEFDAVWMRTMVTTMTVSVVGGRRTDVVAALRAAGLSVENALMGTADTAWSIKEDKR